MFGAKCLKIIFEASAVYPEIYRMLSGTVVPQFIEILDKLKLENVDRDGLQQLMDTLTVCIQVYRGPCYSRKTCIQQFLLRNLENLNRPDSDLLANPFALLAFTCNVKQASDFRTWTDYMVQSLYTINSLLSDLLSMGNVNDLPMFQNPPTTWLHLIDKSSHAIRVIDFSKKFSFVCRVAEHLLLQEYDSQVKVPVRSILFTINRMLSRPLTSLTRQTANLDELYNNSVLPLIYESSLTLLSALFASCNQNLALYIEETGSIFRELLDATKSVGDTENGELRLLKLRTGCYVTMQQWFASVGVYLASYLAKEWTEKLLNHFYEDVRFKPTSLKLLANKKSARNDRISLKVVSSESQINDNQVQLAYQATVCVETYVKLYGPVLSRKHLNKLVMFVLTELIELYQTGISRQQTYFGTATARKSLFGILRSLAYLLDDSSFINNAINLFNLALISDHDSDIQLYARESLAIYSLARNRIGTGASLLSSADKTEVFGSNGFSTIGALNESTTNGVPEPSQEIITDFQSQTNGAVSSESHGNSVGLTPDLELIECSNAQTAEVLEIDDESRAKRMKLDEPEFDVVKEIQIDLSPNVLLSDDEQQNADFPNATESDQLNQSNQPIQSIKVTVNEPINQIHKVDDEDLYSDDSSIEEVMRQFVPE